MDADRLGGARKQIHQGMGLVDLEQVKSLQPKAVDRGEAQLFIGIDGCAGEQAAERGVPFAATQPYRMSEDVIESIDRYVRANLLETKAARLRDMHLAQGADRLRHP